MSLYYVLGSGVVKQLLIEDLFDLAEIFQQSHPFDALVALEKKWIADCPSIPSIKSEAFNLQNLEDNNFD